MDVVLRQGESGYLEEVVAQIGRCGAGWLIVPTRVDRDRWKRLLADRAPGLAFGLRIETIGDWTADRWSLFGNGARIIDRIRQRLAMGRALDRANAGVPDYQRVIGLGAAGILCEAMALGSGIPSFERRMSSEEAADASQGRAGTAWEAMRSYRADIHARGYIEAGLALATLIDDRQALAFGRPVVAAGFSDATPMERRFLRACCDAVVLETGDSPAFDAVHGFAELLVEGGGSGAIVEGDAPAPDGYSPYACPARAPELEALSAHLYRAGDAIEPTGAVRFALPAGSYAVAPAIASEVMRFIGQGADPGDVYVVCADPGATCHAVAPLLTRLGVGAFGPRSQKLDLTALGMALDQLLCLVAMCDEEEYSVRPGLRFVDVLCGLAMSRCSGIPLDSAYKLAAHWRGNPHLQTADAHLHVTDFVDRESERALEKSAWGLMDLVELARTGRIAEAAEQMAANAWPRLSEEDRLLQKRAIGRVYAIAEACDEFGASIAEYDQLVTAATVQVGMQADAPGEGPAGSAVRFVSLEEAQGLDMPYAVFADLTATSYPITRDDTAAVRLVAADDLDPRNRLLPTIRWAFYRAIRNVSRGAVFERELATYDNKAERPSVLFEEVADCYSPDPADFRNADGATGLPVAVLPGNAPVDILGRYDEADLMGILPEPAYVRLDGGQPAGTPFEPVPTGVFEGHGVSELMQQPVRGKVVFSPSSVEAYTMCPYGWYVKRRVNAKALDADPLSPQAVGLLAHLAFQRFYEMWDASGHHPRLTRDALDDARPIFEKAFDQALAEREASDDSPLLPVTSMDAQELARHKRDFWKLLRSDVDFLPAGFAPREFEFSFGYSNDDCRYPEVEYAGRAFRGSIDRIDVSSVGRHAVITDYKGRTGKEAYSPIVTAPEHGGEGHLVLPPHIQIFMYAGIAQKLLRAELGEDLEVVGAFYRSYKPGNPTCGAYSMLLSDDDGAPPFAGSAIGLPVDGPTGFQELIEHTERLVAVALDAMERGYFSAAPRTELACTFCPVKAVCASAITDKAEVTARWI